MTLPFSEKEISNTRTGLRKHVIGRGNAPEELFFSRKTRKQPKIISELKGATSLQERNILKGERIAGKPQLPYNFYWISIYLNSTQKQTKC
jgi:uncharacterized protein YbcI